MGLQELINQLFLSLSLCLSLPPGILSITRALKPLAEQPSGEAAIASGEGAARAFGLLVERGAEWLSSPADRVRAVTWGLLFGLRHEVGGEGGGSHARCDLTTTAFVASFA